MKHNHFELYSRYYNATVGRFYTSAQREKLLALFATSFEIYPETKEFEAVLSTIKTVDELGIKDYNESKNYQLICNILNTEDELFSAASALAQCYQTKLENKEPTYSGPIQWRASVCKSLGESETADLENAYIKYCCNMVDDAIDILKDRADGGSLLALEHLAIICAKEEKHEDSLFYLSLLEKTVRDELCLEVGGWIQNMKKSLLDKVAPEISSKIATRVKKNARIVTEGRTQIGFNISTSNNQKEG